MSLTVGIDFGTATSSAAIIKDGRLQLVPCQDGALAVPSVIALDYEGKVMVGESARQFASVDASRVVFGAKRFLGRKLYSPEASWLAGVCANEVVPADNGDAWLRIGDRLVSPQEIAAYILRHLRQQAEALAGEPITSAAIATPAYMGLLQRRAILEAASLAGFGVVRLVDDGMAAMVGCDSINKSTRRLLFMDLGAGYFDVGLFQNDGDRWTPLANSGDTVLGGEDFDRRIIDQLLMTFRQVHSVDLTQSPSALEQLREVAHRTKHELTDDLTSSPIELTVAPGIGHDELTLAHPPLLRAQFDTLIRTDLENLCQPCAWVFEDAKLSPKDIDEVVLLGAGAQVPAVRDLVERMVRRRPLCPDTDAQPLALGAAVLGHAVGTSVSARTACGATSHTLCINAKGGRMIPIVERAQSFPTDIDRTFAKTRVDQQSIVFEIYQGDSASPRDNVYVGRFVIEGLPAGDRFVVRFSIDENGMLDLKPHHADGTTQVLVLPSNGLGHEGCAALRANLASEVSSNAALGSIPPQDGPESEASIALGWSDMPPSSTRVPVTCPPSSMESYLDDPDDAPTLSTRPCPSRCTTVPPLHPEHAPPTAASGARAAVDDSGSSIKVDVDPLVGSTIEDRYVIEALLAEGGMGRVYQAEHKLLGRRLAIKVLHPELATNEQLGERFLREARAAAAIDSDHVIDIIDFGRLDEGTSYFVMEFLEGETLGEWLADHGASAPEFICHVGAQVAEGMAAAHATGIVHRDLKPDNLTLVHRKGKAHFVKILDFGIAKRPTSDGGGQLTLVGTTLGTPFYMSPEQITAGEVDARSDIYSLGAVMYEMATGQPPFDSDVLALLLSKHLSEVPKPIREHAICTAFPAQLEALILKCLEKQADDRFQSARELGHALARL